MGKINILMTGGHGATTAIAVIEEIRRRNKNWQIFWVGAKKATEGPSVNTLESAFFPGLGVRFYALFTGRVQNKFSLWTLYSLAKIPFGFLHALYLIVKIRPCLIFSFGGFSAFPIVVIGWLLGIPVIIHEQTAVVGRANKWSSFFAKKILISRKSSLDYFPNEKTIIVGNPVRTEFLRPNSREDGTRKTIFVTGGSRGSSIINKTIAKILMKTLPKYRLIHQTGGKDFETYKNLKMTLDSEMSQNYEVHGAINPSDMGKIYSKSDIVISRAGANTVSEIIALKKPAILIPIPWSYMDEQNKNAEYARDIGLAKIISQDKLTGILLRKEINELIKEIPDIRDRVKSISSPDEGAAGRIADILEEIISE